MRHAHNVLARDALARGLDGITQAGDILSRVAQYLPAAADFDGAADSFDYANAWHSADVGQAYGSLWFRMDGGNNARGVFFHCNNGFRFGWERTSGNVLQFKGLDSGLVNVCNMLSATAYTANAAYRHLLFSIDLPNTTGQLYVDGADDLDGASAFVDALMDYPNVAQFEVGIRPDGAGGALNGVLTELWMKFAASRDFSLRANRELFRTREGFPAQLGANGELVDGTRPEIYFKGGDFTVNLGATDVGTVTPAGAVDVIDGP